MIFFRSLILVLMLILLSAPTLADSTSPASSSESLALSEVPITVTQPSGMIYMPALSLSDPGDIEFSAGLDTFSDGHFGITAGVMYSPIEQLEVGVRLANLNNLVSSMQLTIFELEHLYRFSKFKVGVGFNSIYDTGHLEKWENKSAYKANLFAHYLTTSFEWGEATVHLGLTQPQTQLDKGNRDALGGFFDDVDHFFVGVSTPLGAGHFLIEFDTEDIHFGYQYPIQGGRAVEVRRYDVLQGISRFSKDNEPQLQYGIEFKARHNYFRKLYEDSARAKSQLETSKRELRSLAKDFEVIQMSYHSLQDSQKILEDKLNALDLLQKDLIVAKKQFESDAKSLRQENSQLLKLLKEQRGIHDSNIHKPLPVADTSPMPWMSQNTRNTSPEFAPVPAKLFSEVGKSLHN